MMHDEYSRSTSYQSNAPTNQRRSFPAPPCRDRTDPWVVGRSGFSDNRFSQRFDNQRDRYPRESPYDRRANVTSSPGRYPRSDFRQQNYKTTGRQEERPQANTLSLRPRPIAQNVKRRTTSVLHMSPERSLESIWPVESGRRSRSSH